jgi:hypothetical protein
VRGALLRGVRSANPPGDADELGEEDKPRVGDSGEADILTHRSGLLTRGSTPEGSVGIFCSSESISVLVSMLASLRSVDILCGFPGSVATLRSGTGTGARDCSES